MLTLEIGLWVTVRIVGWVRQRIWAKEFIYSRKERGEDGRPGLGDIALESLEGSPSVPWAAWFGVWGRGRGRPALKAYLGVIMHIGGSWSIWCPKHHFGDEQPAGLLLLCDGWARGGWGRASLIITAEQLEPFILGGSQVIPVGTDAVFSLSWKAFPETNSGCNHYAGWHIDLASTA